MVYVTVYVPGVLVDGVIAPVAELIDSPAVELKTPPVVPVRVTDCGVLLLVQKEDGLYCMVAFVVVVEIVEVAIAPVKPELRTQPFASVTETSV